MRTLLIIAFFLLLRSPGALNAQEAQPFPDFPMLDSLLLYAGDERFSTGGNMIFYNGKHSLAFKYRARDETVRGELFLRKDYSGPIRLAESADFDVLDSLQWTNDRYYRFRIRFKNLSASAFTALSFETAGPEGQKLLFEAPLFPHAQTEANFFPPAEDLFLGEPRQYEILSNDLDNLALDGQWRTGDAFNYRMQRAGEKAHIVIEPKKHGEHVLELAFETKKPFLDSLNNPVFRLPTLRKTFNVRSTRIAFLRFDERQLVRNPDAFNAVEVTVENHRLLQTGKLYRIETAEAPGSPLVAELIPQRRLTNDKALCLMRLYNNHLLSEGNLFVKENETLLFLTNFEIIPTPVVEKVSILRNGGEWSDILSVRPGEIVDLRIEGKYLGKAAFYFDELKDLHADTLQNTNIVRNFRLQAPIGISKKKINALLNQAKTNIEFAILEHQTPRPIDFMYIDYGTGPVSTAQINQPILYPQTIKDVIISFDRGKIDEMERLYGRQHLRISVRLEDKDGILLESALLGNFFICPDENSPRYSFYPKAQCRLDEIRINDILRRKTHILEEWGKIEITFEHVGASYAAEGYTKRVIIYNQKRASFDVDVSVPAGLFVQNLGRDEPLASLTGISFAMIAQFSFYRRDEIQKLIPFKAGVGFLAQNAFNFNPEARRDLGIIAIASVYPIRGTNKVSFPLYGGFGYFLQENKFFALIGPGIRVSF